MSGKALGGKRATRQEIEIILDKLYSLGFKEQCKKFEVCGSYRRGKPDSGDIDIVIIPKDSFKDWFDNLDFPKRKGHFADNALINEVQVDFFLCNESNYTTSVLTWTGSRGFNIMMRGKSLKAGYIYTRFGMYKKDTKKLVIGINKEIDIFNLIGLKYIHPEMR